MRRNTNQKSNIMLATSLKPILVERTHRCLSHTCVLFFFLALAIPVSAATDYGFYLANIRVTSDNCNNIPHNDVFTRGTASYNNSTKTLTLNNVIISRTGNGHNCIDNVSCDGLHVVFKGTCLLSSDDDYAVVIRDADSKNATTFTVEGSATLESINKSALCYKEDDNYHDWYINGPGTLVVKSTYSYAMEGNQAVYVHFQNGITATFNGGKGAVHNFSGVLCRENSELTLRATYKSSNPIVSQTNLQFFAEEENDFWDLNADGYMDTGDVIYEYKHPVVLSPWGAKHDNNMSTVLYNGSPIYNQDIVVSNRYSSVIIKTLFPDNNFRSYLASLYPKMYITESESQALTDLNVSGKSISSMEGIQYLEHVKYLYCQSNSLTSLDLSGNSALTTLNCSNNNLTSLTGLDDNTNITSIICSNNKFTTLYLQRMPKLTSLDVRNNPSLTDLHCRYSALTSLSLSGCSNLQTLDCQRNSFTSLTITGMTKLHDLNCKDNYSLKTLNCYNNALTYLNVWGCNELTSLSCYGNKFTSLSVNSRSKLTTLDCHNNPLLQTLNCYENALTSLDVSGCSELTSLDCEKNKFTSLTVTNHPKLQTLDCSGNSLLEFLNCSNNALTSLDINSCSQLQDLICDFNDFETFDCSGKNLSSLSISYNPQLTRLYCNDNALTTLEVYGCTSLSVLQCTKNQLAELDLKDCAALQFLTMWGNKIQSIDLSYCPILKQLSCSSNQLTALNVSGNPLLDDFLCDENRLTQLDVSACSNLSRLSCNKNSLTSLTLTGCNKLKTLNCALNNLSSLIMPNSSSLYYVSCYANRLSGSGMNALVASLPNRRTQTESGIFYVYYPAWGSAEQNVCTSTNINDAWQKNWKTYWNDGTGMVPYGVGTPTSLSQPEMSSDNESAPRYNLSGQRVGDSYKGIVIQKNRKMVK